MITKMSYLERLIEWVESFPNPFKERYKLNGETPAGGEFNMYSDDEEQLRIFEGTQNEL